MSETNIAKHMSEGKFIRKETEVQAIQWTGQNFWVVYDFISKCQNKNVKSISVTQQSEKALFVCIGDLNVLISNNGWLCYSAGKFSSVSGSEFGSDYYEEKQEAMPGTGPASSTFLGTGPVS